MKVLFMGTPEFAASSLNALLASKHEVVGVVTQPDRAVKRGKSESSAVKHAAERAGLNVIQPIKIRTETERLKAFGADIAVTAAYGQLLTQDVLDSFPKGVINVHASLLPKYRGASPVQAAIAAGETETGVTIMQTELGLDSGDILAVSKTEITAEENAGELMERLGEIGAKLLVETLDNFDGITPIKQNDALATHCKTIKKHELFIDFSKSAKEVTDRIRALAPMPCARTEIDGEVYKIFKASVIECDTNAKFGTVTECGKRLVVACGSNAVAIERIQAPSKRALCIEEFLRGKKFDVGVTCGILQ